MTLREALKNGCVIEVDDDVYLTKDNRVLKYDRYWGKTQSQCRWICEDEGGKACMNFNDAYYYRSY